MCQHSDYHISECKKELDLGVLRDLTKDLEIFPGIESDCTEHCKKKMIRVVELTMKHYTEIAVNYFKDAKLGIKEEDECTGLSYFLYCICKDEHGDEDFLERVEKAMNVKIVDGEVVHLKPEDNNKSEMESVTSKGSS